MSWRSSLALMALMAALRPNLAEAQIGNSDVEAYADTPSTSTSTTDPGGPGGPGPTLPSSSSSTDPNGGEGGGPVSSSSTDPATDTSSDIDFYYVTAACPNANSAVNGEGSWLTGLVDGIKYTVECTGDDNEAEFTADSTKVMKLLTTDLRKCTAIKVVSSGSDDIDLTAVTAIPDATDDQKLTKSGSSPYGWATFTCDDGGVGVGDALKFDTVVRISSENCKATDIGRDYGGDGESTTTISPEDAITNDSVYIGGDVTATPGTIVFTCKKAPVGDADAVEVERSVSVTIPALVDLRSNATDDNPAIMLNECQKLLVKRAGSTTSIGICFGPDIGMDSDCQRNYAAVPSSKDSSLDAAPISGGGQMPGWMDVVGEGCNEPPSETGTTGSPGGGSVMAGLGVGAIMAVCAAIAL